MVLGEDLPPFAQTTAIALIGLSGLDADLEVRGLRSLGRLWRVESAGGLSLATALIAFREHGRPNEAQAVRTTLNHLVQSTRLQDDGVALGWAALAMRARSPWPGG